METKLEMENGKELTPPPSGILTSIPNKKPAKRARHREGYKSSHGVFTHFVKISKGKDGEDRVEVSEIFSQECFNMWLRTRAKPPKQPNESFRRALTAHVKGVDGRKPFVEDVERELIKVLRQRKIWACFQNCSQDRIGTNGFRGLGYHEKRHRKKVTQKRQQPQEIYKGNENVKSCKTIDTKETLVTTKNQKRPRCSSRSAGPFTNKSNTSLLCSTHTSGMSTVSNHMTNSQLGIGVEPSDTNIGNHMVKKDNDLDYNFEVDSRDNGNYDVVVIDTNTNPRKGEETDSIMITEPILALSDIEYIDNSRAQVAPKQNDSLIMTREFAGDSKYALSTDVAYWLSQVFTKRERHVIAHTTKSLGMSWFDPSVFLSIDRISSPHHADPRLSRFVFDVSPECQKFFPGRACGYILFERGSKMILEHDHNASLLLQSNTLKSTTMYRFIPSATEAILRLYSVADKLNRGQTTWTRARFIRGDNTLGYFLLKVRRCIDSRTLIEFQDISEEMSPLLQIERELV